jgi:hypothetical protein
MLSDSVGILENIKKYFENDENISKSQNDVG